MEFDKKYIIQNEHFNKIVYYTLYCAICSIFTVRKIVKLDTTLESKKNPNQLLKLDEEGLLELIINCELLTSTYCR